MSTLIDGFTNETNCTYKQLLKTHHTPKPKKSHTLQIKTPAIHNITYIKLFNKKINSLIQLHSKAPLVLHISKTSAPVIQFKY